MGNKETSEKKANRLAEASRMRAKGKKSFLISRNDYRLKMNSLDYRKTVLTKHAISLPMPSHMENKEINFDELVTCDFDVTKIYKLADQPIGKGFFGEVRLGKLPSFPSKIFAIKSIDKEKFKEDIAILSNEVDHLKELSHPNVIRFYESYQDSKFFHIVVDYCSGGELKTLIEKKGGLDEGVARRFMKQILWAISYIHSRGICNRDIKADNFLISNQGEDPQLKMIDFGLSVRFKEDEEFEMEDTVGTPYYVAPEVLLQVYDHRCDLWSAGVLMFYMLSGNYPFNGDTDDILQENIIRGNFNFRDDSWRNVSKPAKNLLKQLLDTDPGNRPSASQALDHKWFVGSKRNQMNMSVFASTQIMENLNEFKAENSFQKMVSSIMANMLCELEIRHIRRVFRQIDEDHLGSISPKHLQKFLESNGHCLLHPIEQIIQELKLHSTHPGVLTYDEFIVASIDKQFFLSDAKLREAFRYMDVDNSRTISVNNLKEIFSRQGDIMTDMQVKKMLEELRSLGVHDQKITMEMFLRLMSLKGLRRQKNLTESVRFNNRLYSESIM